MSAGVDERPAYRAIASGILAVACPACGTRFDGSITPPGVPHRCPRCRGEVAATNAEPAAIAAAPARASEAGAMIASSPAASPASVPATPAASEAADAAAASVGAAPATATPEPSASSTGASCAADRVAALVAKPQRVHVLGVLAIVFGGIDLLIALVLGGIAIATCAGHQGLGAVLATVLACQTTFLVQIGLLIGGGVMLVRNRPRGRTLALVHALSIVPTHLAATILLTVACAMARTPDGQITIVGWAMPFAGIFAMVLLALLNGREVRTWALRQRLLAAGEDLATLPDERLHAKPVSGCALWAAAIVWWFMPPILPQIAAIVLAIIGLVATSGRDAARGGRAYACYALATCAGFALLVIASAIFYAIKR